MVRTLRTRLPIELLLRRTVAIVIVIALGLCVWHPCQAWAAYVQTNLVSDLPGVAAHTDANLVNPWGIASSATSPFWVADNHTGVSTLYDSSGTPQALVVTVPPSPGGLTGAPTGVVFNGSSDFELTALEHRRSFIFATEDGTISGWNSGTSAILKVINSAGGTVYKGLAIGNNGTSNFLYVANFKSSTIDVFDTNYSPTTLSGGFTDPVLPSGFAPFNIQNIGGTLYVAYAKPDATGHDDVPGPGNGFIDTFDLNGNFLGRLVSNGALNSPWGLAIAPAGFGTFANDLLVGNFGDGRINVFDPVTGALLGQLTDSSGNPITIEGLWGMHFGNGGNGGDPNTLYFTAGIPGPDTIEDHGLFGSISVPEPSSMAICLVMIACAVAVRACRQARRTHRVCPSPVFLQNED